MRLLRIDEIPENTPLGQSIFDERGHLLLGEGYPLRQYELSRIRSLGYDILYVNTPESEKVTIVPVLSARVDSQLHKLLFEQFDQISSAIKSVKLPPEKIATDFDNIPELREVLNINNAVMGSRLLIEELELKGMEPLDMLLLKGKINYLRDHSINTAIMSVLLGYRFGLRRNDLIEISLAAMMHCCGLLFIPQFIGRDEITFTDSEWQQYQLYPTLSERCIGASTDRFFRARRAILEHREKQDGTGFPCKIRGANRKPNFQDTNGHEFIYPMAEIIAVAAAFDEYVGRGFGLPMSLEEAGLNIIARIGHDLNTGIVETWLNTCSIFPPGVTIRVIRCDDKQLVGGLGIIQKSNWDKPHHPRVVMLQDGQGKRLDQLEADFAKFSISQIRMIL